MKELTVFLNYAPNNGASETALPLRVLDADGGVVAESVARTSQPVIVSVSSVEEPLFVRLTWPSGKTETKRAHSAEVSFSDESFQPDAWTSWAAPRVSELVNQDRSVAFPSEGKIDRFDRAWVRLWQFDGSSWRIAKILPRACYRNSLAIQMDLSLGQSNWCLQIGGRVVPWQFVSLPGGECRVLITPNESNDPRAELLKVAVTGFRTETETLLEFLSRDQLRAAHAVATFEPLARSLLERKFSDPIAAVASAYFFLRTEGWKSIPLSWFDNLSDFSWIPDVFIVRCTVKVRSGLAEKSDVQSALELFEQCLRHGLPLFAEGLALLREIASVLRPTAKNQRGDGFARVERLVVSQLWAGAALSFTGTKPDSPAPERQRGVPSEHRKRGRSKNSGTENEKILFFGSIREQASA